MVYILYNNDNIFSQFFQFNIPIKTFYGNVLELIYLQTMDESWKWYYVWRTLYFIRSCYSLQPNLFI